MPKLSIIIPVYNAEKYIRRCLNSLINQTLNDIEIICVNDGSTDNSMILMREIAKSDSRIKLIEQVHQKQGAARNNGMRVSKGEYIGFVDADDWVDLNFFEKLYNAAVKYGADIAFGTNVRIGNGKTKKRLNITGEYYCTALQDKFDICSLAKNPCPTNKIYKSEMLKSNIINWPEGCYCEDKLFVTKAVYYANGVVSVAGVNYYYFRNPNSTVNSRKLKHWIELNNDKKSSRRAVLQFLKEKNANIRDKEFWAITKEIMFMGIPVYREKSSLHTKKTYFMNYIKLGEQAI